MIKADDLLEKKALYILRRLVTAFNYLTRSSGLSHITVHISTMKHRKLLLFVAESRVCTISEHCIIVFFILI